MMEWRVRHRQPKGTVTAGPSCTPPRRPSTRPARKRRPQPQSSPATRRLRPFTRCPSLDWSARAVGCPNPRGTWPLRQIKRTTGRSGPGGVNRSERRREYSTNLLVSRHIRRPAQSVTRGVLGATPAWNCALSRGGMRGSGSRVQGPGFGVAPYDKRRQMTTRWRSATMCLVTDGSPVYGSIGGKNPPEDARCAKQG